MVTRVMEQAEQAQFREAKAEGKASLHISVQGADYARSMEILAKNGLRPLTYLEAFSRFPELITELRGKWFYLAGKGLDKKSGFYTFNELGELAELAGNETYDRKVRVWSGDQPLSIYVASSTRDAGRFYFGAIVPPYHVAWAVVGVKIDEGKPLAGGSGNAPQTFLERIRQAVFVKGLRE